MKVIVYRRPGGGVNVVNPAPKHIADLMAGGITEDEALAVLQAKAVPPGSTNIKIMEQALLPSREFRDAWEKIGLGPISIDMPKARIIHTGKINRAKNIAVIKLQQRADKAALEGRATDATQASNDKAAVEGLDLTAIATLVANAQNPAALSAIWPVELQEFRP